MSQEKVLEFCTFFEEVPIRGRAEVLSSSRKVAELKVLDSYFLKALNFTKRLYYKKNSRIYGADVIFLNGDFINTTAFKPVIEPKFERSVVRVSTSLSCPVTAEISFYYKSEEKEKHYRVLDVSELGIGVLASVSDYTFLLGNLLRIKLEVSTGKAAFSIVTKGKVVRKELLSDGKQKVGIFFLDLSRKERDLLAQYVSKRQREIISLLKVL